MEEKQQRRNRIAIRMVGSSFVRGLHKLPQLPPKNPKAIAEAKPQLKELPTCPHGEKITQPDFDLYQRVYAGRVFDGSQVLLDSAEVLPDGSIVGPHAFEAKACPECFPMCAHGEQLTSEEISAAKESGKKLSSGCPVCIGSSDPRAWNQFLDSIGFSAYRGVSPATHYVPTLEGGVHALGQRRTFVSGGSQEMEEVDARSPVARDDVSARSKPKATLETDEKE